MRYIATFLIILFTVSSLFGALARTKTIGTDTLSIIRTACEGNDQMIQNYYLEYKGNSKEDEETVEEIFDERGKMNILYRCTASYETIPWRLR